MQRSFFGSIIPLLLVGFLLCGCNKNSRSAETLSIWFGSTPKTHGLFQRNLSGDGRTELTTVEGEDCAELVLKEGRSIAYLYLNVDPEFKIKARPLPPLIVTVEYFDAKPATFFIEYDSAIEGKGGGAYTPSKEQIQTKGLQEWQTAKFILDRPYLAGRQNDHADFRIRLDDAANAQFCVRSITLSKH